MNILCPQKSRHQLQRGGILRPASFLIVRAKARGVGRCGAAYALPEAQKKPEQNTFIVCFEGVFCCYPLFYLLCHSHLPLNVICGRFSWIPAYESIFISDHGCTGHFDPFGKDTSVSTVNSILKRFSSACNWPFLSRCAYSLTNMEILCQHERQRVPRSLLSGLFGPSVQ